MDSLKLVIERHSDGFVSYPLGLKGVVIGRGDTYEEALADIRSAIDFHIETFGPEAFESDSPILEAFIAEIDIPILAQIATARHVMREDRDILSRLAAN